MDIQKIISDVLEKLNADEGLKNDFLADPIKALEKLTGIDLPDEQIQAVIDGIKAKLNLDENLGKAKGLLGKLKGLFGK